MVPLILPINEPFLKTLYDWALAAAVHDRFTTSLFATAVTLVGGWQMEEEAPTEKVIVLPAAEMS